MPNFASCDFRFGASAPMPPICIPIELKFAKPHSANVAIVNERGSSAPFIGPSMENATNSLTHHARAQQISDLHAIVPRHADDERHRRKHPAENLLQARRKPHHPVPAQKIVNPRP